MLSGPPLVRSTRCLLQRPRKREGERNRRNFSSRSSACIGAPIINIYVVCECKSLSGSDVLLSPGEFNSPFDSRMIGDWSGYDRHMRELVEFIAQDPTFPNCNKNLLYSYFRDRAYPDDLELVYDLKLPSPQIELTATAFRETKGGRDDKDRPDRVSPLWNAFQSVLAATTALEARTLETMRAWSMERSSYGYEQNEFIRNLAFIFDAELARRVSYHPVVFCKAKLFNLTESGIEDVQSARIYLGNLSFQYRYIDVVRIENAVSYLDDSLTHFEKLSSKAIRKTWDRLEDLQWAPGQALDQLALARGVLQIEE
jgi:hypothetical protein